MVLLQSSGAQLSCWKLCLGECSFLPTPGLTGSCQLPPTLKCPSRSPPNKLFCVQFFCDPVDCSPPGSSARGISHQVYWSGLPFPSFGDFPNPGIEPTSPALQTNSLPLNHLRSPQEEKQGSKQVILLQDLLPELAGRNTGLHNQCFKT